MKRFHVCVMTVLVAMGVPFGSSDVAGEDAHWRTRPGHLSLVTYEFPEEPGTQYQVGHPDDPGTQHQLGYSDIDFYVTVVQDPGNSLRAYAIPADVIPQDTKLGYYWANDFSFAETGNFVDGYMGIQTIGEIFDADPADRQNAAQNHFVGYDRLALFSIWNALDARPAGPDSYCATFGHEGVGWSCKVVYPWRQGVKYRLRIWQLAHEPEWWRGAIRDTTTNQETIVGDIRVSASRGRLSRTASAFTEVYTPTVNQQIGDADDGKANPRVCQYMPKAEVLIDPPTANDGHVEVSTMTPWKDGKCAAVSSFYLDTGPALSSGASLDGPHRLTNRTGTLNKRVLVLRQHPVGQGGWEIEESGPVEVNWIGDGHNDQISSLTVGDGYTVELFRHWYFGGTRLTLHGPQTVDVAELSGYGMNDQISSYKLYATPPLVLRQHPLSNASGWEITQPGPVEVPATGPGEGDQISAILVGDGYTVEVFRHPDFQGTQLTYHGPQTVDVAELADYGMNDQISSYKLSTTPPLVLRQHPLSNASGWEITEPGPVEVNWIGNWYGGAYNDQISSLIVGDGYTVELFQHAYFTGTRLIYHGPRTIDAAELAARGMADQISSYELYATP